MRGDDAKYIQLQIFWISSWIITHKRVLLEHFFVEKNDRKHICWILVTVGVK